MVEIGEKLLMTEAMMEMMIAAMVIKVMEMTKVMEVMEVMEVRRIMDGVVNVMDRMIDGMTEVMDGAEAFVGEDGRTGERVSVSLCLT
jgi:hypothetical protein